MKYNVGDKVRIKSKEWYKNMSNSKGYVIIKDHAFTESMSRYCGKECTITKIHHGSYCIDIDNGEWYWTDEMFEDEIVDTTTYIIKKVANVIKNNNLGVSVKEEDGKLIIEPLEKKEDLPVDTPCMCGNSNNEIWSLRYYAYNGKVFSKGLMSPNNEGTVKFEYIIPFEKFDPNDIEESLKHNIVKK